jgi:molybdopterin-containing oxidoreductase family membrane subunit
VTLIGLIIYFVFEFAEFSIALWNPNVDAPAIELILWGPYWWVFWIMHLFLGGIVPLALLLTRRPQAWVMAALLVAITFISARLNVLVPGQAVGEIQGLQDAFHHHRLTYLYHATAMEYLVGLFLLAVGMAVFYVGEQISVRLADRGTRRGSL